MEVLNLYIRNVVIWKYYDLSSKYTHSRHWNKLLIHKVFIRIKIVLSQLQIELQIMEIKIFASCLMSMQLNIIYVCIILNVEFTIIMWFILINITLDLFKFGVEFNN